jgi:membrane protein required for colicin V production
MAIDIIFLILMLIAVVKGLQRGLIVAIFSVLACIIGLAAAIKLSAVVAVYLKSSTQWHSKWLPIIAFILVFLAVVLLVRWIANLIETAINFAFMEWLNKLGGAILYVALYTAVFSIILFYGSRSHIISTDAIASSRVYKLIEPLGPAVVNDVGKIIPVFRNMFTALEDFFAGLAQKSS